MVVGVDVGPAAADDADEAPRRDTHFQRYLGLCWAVLTHLEPQSRKNGRSKKHCKTHNSWGVSGGGGTPLSPSERRDAYGKDTAMAGPRGPLAGFKGLRLTAGAGPLGSVGRMSRLCWRWWDVY